MKVGAIEKATRVELAGLPDSALVQVALELAQRLDGTPADTAAVLLARELRMTLGALRNGGEDPTNDVERFLARIATPDSRDPAH